MWSIETVWVAPMTGFEHADSQFALFLGAAEMKDLKEALRIAKEVYSDRQLTMKILGSSQSFKVAALNASELLKGVSEVLHAHKH
jgi:hypothetical protein